MTESPLKKASKSSKKARATAARLCAVQAVYQALQLKVPPESLLDEYKEFRAGMPIDGEEMVQPDGVLFSGLLKGITARWNDLQQMIAPRVKTQSVEPLLTAILVCGAYELMAHHDLDAPIIISDYLHVTHGFFEGQESRLVNGILDALAKEIRA